MTFKDFTMKNIQVVSLLGCDTVSWHGRWRHQGPQNTSMLPHYYVVSQYRRPWLESNSWEYCWSWHCMSGMIW